MVAIILAVLCLSTVGSAYPGIRRHIKSSSQKTNALDALATLFLSSGKLLPGHLTQRHHTVNDYRLRRVPDIVGSAGDQLPPEMPDSDGYAVGSLKDSAGVWWRQSPELFQIICQLADNVSFKKDVKVSVTQTDISLRIAGADVVVGQFPFKINTEKCDWLLEDEVNGFPDGPRYLVVDLAKDEPFVDWPGPVVESPDAAAKSKRLIIGGGYNGQTCMCCP
jgi:hypothetical protein